MMQITEDCFVSCLLPPEDYVSKHIAIICFIYLPKVFLANYISGCLIDEEAANQHLGKNTNFIEVIRKHGFVPGIVVDKGVTSFSGESYEYITDGIVGLSERCVKYKESGCDFAKWRSVFLTKSVFLSTQGLRDNAKIISRVALKCQQEGLVPIIDVDVMPLGDHSITTAQDVFEMVTSEVMKALQDHHVFLEGMILKTSLVAPGHRSEEIVPPREIARSTFAALSRTVPPAVAGILLRGGGKFEEEATVLLNELTKQQGRKPWPITFAFGRCLQLSAIKAWNGKQENVIKAQNELLQRAKANSEASLGKYVTGNTIGMASEFTMSLKDPSFY